jgi:D-alanine transaminase
MVVYLNGAFLPPDEAHVSPLDRGFLFGDGIYEVIPSYQGRFFLLDEHIARLRRSLREIRMPEPQPDQGWAGLLEQLLGLNPGGDRSVYLQVTRGAAARDHAFPKSTAATVFAMVSPIAPSSPDLSERGIAAILLPDQRWGRCDIKAVALLPNVLARQQAVEQGAVEALLLRDGMLTEGAASNVFVVSGGAVVTPPLGQEILPGVTRRFLLDTLREEGWDCREDPVPESVLRSADEIWLTSSTKELLPVTALDGRPVGGGRPGPVWKGALDVFRRARDRSVASAAAGANRDE